MMDDEDGPPNSYGINNEAVDNDSYPRNVGKSSIDDDDSDDDEDMDNEEDNEDDNDDDVDDDDDGGNGVLRIGKDDYEYGDEDNGVNDDFGDFQRHPKKRKLKTLLSNYEIVPRLPAPSSASAFQKPKNGGRNPLTDWTEHETFVLLEAWGERFLKQGRKSLRSEEWQEVAEKVSEQSKIERTDTQCRNRLDTLKKKYKKEKMKLGGNTENSASKWMYFNKMDSLMSSPPPQQAGLSCGVDSGEYMFMNPKVYLNQSNGLDEMRDSPDNSASEGLPPQGTKGATSFKLLADSIKKFCLIYQKIENSKRQQMVELEKMRMDLHRDLEFQKREILERAQAQIEKIREGDDGDDNDVSAENISG